MEISNWSAMENPQTNEFKNWETITRARKYRKGHSITDSVSQLRPESIESLNPPDKRMTLDDLKKSHATATIQWQSSRSRRKLLEMLDIRQPFQNKPNWELKTAICLATGSFSRTNTTLNRRAMQQFAAFYDICEWLRAFSTQTFEILAQEPRFTNLDREFLESLSVRVLEIGPQGSQDLGPAIMHITVDTFVFEPFLERKINILRQLYAAHPRLYIGSSMHGLEEEAYFKSSPDSGGEDLKATIESAPHITRHDVEFDCDNRKFDLDSVERNREMNFKAMRFVKSRKPGKLFPKFDEGPQIFEGLRVYGDAEENDDC